MPFRTWKCNVCGVELTTKTHIPYHCEQRAQLIITAPSTKFLEKTNAEKGVSGMVDQQKILKERARKHSRETDMDDLIQGNEKDLAYKNGWVRPDGTKRKSIDDK